MTWASVTCSKQRAGLQPIMAAATLARSCSSQDALAVKDLSVLIPATLRKRQGRTNMTVGSPRLQSFHKAIHCLAYSACQYDDTCHEQYREVVYIAFWLHAIYCTILIEKTSCNATMLKLGKCQLTSADGPHASWLLLQLDISSITCNGRMTHGLTSILWPTLGRPEIIQASLWSAFGV